MELYELTNSIISYQIVSDNKIQISILILKRGALSRWHPRIVIWVVQFAKSCKSKVKFIWLLPSWLSGHYDLQRLPIQDKWELKEKGKKEWYLSCIEDLLVFWVLGVTYLNCTNLQGSVSGTVMVVLVGNIWASALSFLFIGPGSDHCNALFALGQ